MRRVIATLAAAVVGLLIPDSAAQNVSPPASDPPDYLQDAGAFTAEARLLAPGAYVGTGGGALGGDGSDDMDCYGVDVPSVWILSVTGTVVSADAAIEFFVISPRGEVFSNAVRQQPDNPVYRYRASNDPGGEWFVCLGLRATGGNAVIHYDLEVGVTPSSRSTGDWGGALRPDLLVAALLLGLARAFLTVAKPGKHRQ